MYQEARASFEAALEQVLEVVKANKVSVPGVGSGAHIVGADGSRMSFSNDREAARTIAKQLLDLIIRGK